MLTLQREQSWKNGKASQVRPHVRKKGPRMGWTPNSRTMVLNWGWFLPSEGHLSMSRGIFELSQLGGDAGTQWVEARDVAEHLMTQCTEQAPQQTAASKMAAVWQVERPDLQRAGDIYPGFSRPGEGSSLLIWKTGEELSSVWAKEVTHKWFQIHSS